jgi:hypothetical protein
MKYRHDSVTKRTDATARAQCIDHNELERRRLIVSNSGTPWLRMFDCERERQPLKAAIEEYSASADALVVSGVGGLVYLAE